MIKKIVFIVCLIFAIPGATLADWQETLEQHFDIVETFDQLQDWHGTHQGYTYDLADMPKKLDNSPSIWTLYDIDNNAYKEDWIANHGSEYNWRSNKSLCINYNPLYCEQDTSPLIGYGPSRLGFYFGDGTATSGYRIMYVFYMMKFPPGFWLKEQDGSYTYPPEIKTFDMITGFESSDEYGAPTCALNQVEYGSNFDLFNVGGGGDSTPNQLFFKINTRVSEWDESNQCYKVHYMLSGEQYRDIDFSNQVEQNKWFGVEYRVDIGTVDTADGSIEMWIFNESGSVIGHEIRTNIELQRLLSFNYNKVILGGNFQCLQDVHKGRIQESRIYYDDFIIDDQPIAQTYFSLLNGVGPNRSNGLPIGEQPVGTTQVTMSLTTDVVATCKYGADGATGVDYASLTNTFTTTGSTSHSVTITGLSNGNSYSRAVRCSDGTDNDTDYVITWSVAAGSQTTKITGTSPMIH